VETIILLIGCMLLVSVLTIIIWFGLNRWLDDRESEFVVYYNILINIIELYKETILTEKINTLRSKFDLNEKSKTNSQSAFERARNELISETVKEIMKIYLSKRCLNRLIKRYGVDGLGLLILTHLKR
jgi:hypothetical protein